MSGVGLLIIVLLFVGFYLVFLRPQRRRQMDQARMWNQLSEGDEVVTAGGIYGTITGFDGDDLLVAIAPDLVVKIARRAIAGTVAEADDETGGTDDDEDEELEDDVDDEPEDDEPDNSTPTTENGSYPEGPR